jgi:hypothetical protein
MCRYLAAIAAQDRRLHCQAQSFNTQVIISQLDIVAPMASASSFRHYVIAPEVRHAQKLVEIVRSLAGQLVKVDISRS